MSSFTADLFRAAWGSALIGLFSAGVAGTLLNRRVTVLNSLLAAGVAPSTATLGYKLFDQALKLYGRERWQKWSGEFALAASFLLFYGTSRAFKVSCKETFAFNVVGAVLAAKTLQLAQQLLSRSR